MAKPARTPEQLRELLLERIEAIPELYGQRTDVHRADVVWCNPGKDGGANWTVRSVTNRDQYRPQIARIIRELQMRYDLHDCSAQCCAVDNVESSMDTLKIGGTYTQGGSGRVIAYEVEYVLDDAGHTGRWGGKVLLRGGHRYDLAGGVLTNVSRSTIDQAVTLALHAEIDGLDLVALNKANGY